MDLIIAEPSRPRRHVVRQVHCSAAILDRFEHGVVGNCLHQLTVAEVSRMSLDCSSVSTIAVPGGPVATRAINLVQEGGVLGAGIPRRKSQSCEKQHAKAKSRTVRSKHLV